MMRIAAAAVIAAPLVSPALAQPPPGVDPNSQIAQWYHSLKQPDNGVGCCGVADCRPSRVRDAGDHWQATLPDGRWVDVPNGKVLTKTSNPTGTPVLCAATSTVSATSGPMVYCLVLGDMI